MEDVDNNDESSSSESESECELGQPPLQHCLPQPQGELRRPTAKGKGFVRPNCSTTFWLNCPVCCKRYFKQDTHFECFARWCEMCQDTFETPSMLALHAMNYHNKNFCAECNNVYGNIKGHRASEHPDAAKTKRRTKASRNHNDET